MTIAGLINKQDTIEIVREAVSNILVAEVASQVSLAAAALEDTRLWTLRVFEERENPWTEFVVSAQSATASINIPPIINVRMDTADVDMRASDPVERQTYNGRITLDCYGYGVSEESGAGHLPADKQAVDAAWRAAKLVRNILMAGEYTYLGMRGIVSRRMVSSIQSYRVDAPEPGSFKLGLVRLALDVRYWETSEQVPVDVIGGVDIEIQRLADGLVLASLSYDASP